MILKDGKVVQQGDPQHILLNPADPYIEDFVSDINRARVLRVSSVMGPAIDGTFDGDVSPNDTLEHLIAVSNGDTAHCYRVVQDDKVVDVLDMTALVRALVPRLSQENTDH